MSDLIAIGYPNVTVAEEARDKLIDMQKEMIIQLADAVIVERRGDGKVKLHQGGSTTGRGAAGGAVWGGLIGLLFFAPFLGMAIGAAGGAMAGKLSDTGIDNDFMRSLGDQLQSGNAALVLLVTSITTDKVLEQMHGQYGGVLLQTSLSADAEEELKAAARAAAAAAA